jgi:hypothetical protein
MAKIGQYNWSPRQMERINARREARGRESLVNLKNIKTEEDLQKAQNLVASSKDTRKPVTMQTKVGATDMGKEAEERTRKFREKFKPKGSMAAEYGVKSSFPTPISKGLRETAGKPLIRKSWDEMNA